MDRCGYSRGAAVEPAGAPHVLVVTLVLWSLAGCSMDTSAGLQHRDTVVIGSAVDMTGVNQLIGAHSRFSQDILDLLFLSLFEEQPDFADHPPTFAPELAASFRWSEDDLTLEVQLRDDVFWSDGVPLTAEDVRWSFDAQTDPDIAWPYASSKEAIESVEVRGDHAVAFHFSMVYATRVADVNEGVILPKHAWGLQPFSRWRSSGAWFRDHLVVSGPYQLKSWRPQDEIVLVRNPGYFRRHRPRIGQVVFRVIPEYNHRLQQLLAGKLDFVEQLRNEDLARLEESHRATPLSYWHRQYSHIVWNACREIFADSGVRRALTLAIDRASIAEALFGGGARVGVTPIPQSVWAFDSDLTPWPYDPAAASELLARAGWGDADGDGVLDKNGVSLEFNLSTNAENSLRTDAAAMIQQQLESIGVKARPVTFEFNTLVDRNIAHDFDATIGAWGIDTTLDLRYAFHSDSIDSGYNYGCYANPEVDRLIEAISAHHSLLEALPLLHRVQGLIHDDQPYTFLWEPKRSDGVARRLQGVEPNPLSAFFNLEDWMLLSFSS